ncbi:MAG TPA: GNAT family N-acetyltransferase [Sedimentisphaerales bacterium]|nr:GNAT family N-acetyltransferase [Sedimentisphaerales bacterium]
MIEIRKGKLGDSEHIVELQLQMARETEGLGLDKTVVSRGVRGVFQEPARGTYWVAEEKGKVLGVLLAIPEWSDWRNATVLWIHSLYVIPEARGQGVFKKLYLNLEKQVEQSPELAGIRLYVDKRNKLAQEVYEKLGMNKHHYELYEWLK